jgi:hypothetical protein
MLLALLAGCPDPPRPGLTASGDWVGTCASDGTGTALTLDVELDLHEVRGAIDGTLEYSIEGSTDDPQIYAMGGTRDGHDLTVELVGHTDTVTSPTAAPVIHLTFSLVLQGDHLYGNLDASDPEDGGPITSLRCDLDR